MKYLKSKLIQKAKGRKRGIYQITLEVTDYDVEMFEDFAKVYVTKGMSDCCEIKDKYHNWMNKVWGCFWQVWRRHDD